MNIKNLQSKAIPSRYQGYVALLLWSIIAILLLRRDLFNLDEAASRALLLSWSISDQIASSVTTFGMPDLRALLFLPVGFLWTGNVFAAKIMAVVLLACAAWFYYIWERRSAGAESALLASGLLIISPLTLEQIDTLSPGVFLLAAFALGSWLDTQYRANPRLFNGWYFAQLFVCAFSTSLHPAGLAYPLALLWSWRTEPLDTKQRKYFWAGITFVVLFVLLVRMGWGNQVWLENPIHSLSAILTPPPLEDGQSAMQWLQGGIIFGLIVAIVFSRFRKIWPDLTGRTLLIALLLGALIGDHSWGFIALSALLYFGLPLLTGTPANPVTGLVKHRGWLLLLVFVCSTFFMRADRAYYEAGHSGKLSAQDQLIKALAVAAENDRRIRDTNDGKNHARFIVASEWPGRTMIACKCDTFPLPPVASDPQSQLTQLHGITYLLLDPKQTANIELARNLSLLGGAIETLSLQPGGVLLHVVENAKPSRNGKPS